MMKVGVSGVVLMLFVVVCQVPAFGQYPYEAWDDETPNFLENYQFTGTPPDPNHYATGLHIEDIFDSDSEFVVIPNSTTKIHHGIWLETYKGKFPSGDDGEGNLYGILSKTLLSEMEDDSSQYIVGSKSVAGISEDHLENYEDTIGESKAFIGVEGTAGLKNISFLESPQNLEVGDTDGVVGGNFTAAVESYVGYRSPDGIPDILVDVAYGVQGIVDLKNYTDYGGFAGEMVGGNFQATITTDTGADASQVGAEELVGMKGLVYIEENSEADVDLAYGCWVQIIDQDDVVDNLTNISTNRLAVRAEGRAYIGQDSSTSTPSNDLLTYFQSASEGKYSLSTNAEYHEDDYIYLPSLDDECIVNFACPIQSQKTKIVKIRPIFWVNDSSTSISAFCFASWFNYPNDLKLQEQLFSISGLHQGTMRKVDSTKVFYDYEITTSMPYEIGESGDNEKIVLRLKVENNDSYVRLYGVEWTFSEVMY